MPPSHEPPASYSHHAVPVPDPTLLTTEQLTRAIMALRELLEARLDGMDKAVALVQAAADRLPAAIEHEVAHLAVVQEVKFQDIEGQFKVRDVRHEQAAKDSRASVDAALRCAQDLSDERTRGSALAVAKSEAATTKQMDALGALIQQTNRAIEGKIDDLKDRLTIIEGKAIGTGGSVATTFSIVTVVLAALATCASVAAVVVAIVRHV